MFLRTMIGRKDGKDHRYWSVVENQRVAGGRTVQSQVLYLVEINDSRIKPYEVWPQPVCLCRPT